MIDFSIKGTKLPMIPQGTIQHCVAWNVEFHSTFNRDYSKAISFGLTNRYKEPFVLVEREDYKQGNHWEVPLKEIERLAKEQGMIEKHEQMKQIDFSIKGTKLPVFPREFKVRAVGCNVLYLITDMELVSFGKDNVDVNDGYILAEKSNYQGTTFYQIPFSVINELAKEQGLIGTRKVLGYKVPYDISSLKIVKGDILTSPMNNGWYFTTGCREKLPQEIVETWEAVYEVEKQILTLGSSNIKIEISRDGIFADGAWFDINELGFLISSRIPIVNARENESTNELRKYNISLVSASYKIGCSVFTLEEIKLMLETYHKFNKK